MTALLERIALPAAAKASWCTYCGVWSTVGSHDARGYFDPRTVPLTEAERRSVGTRGIYSIALGKHIGTRQ